MREHLVPKYSVRDLGGMQKVHFQKTSLKMTLFRLVVLQGVEQEGRRGLNHILRHEDVYNLQLLV